MIEKLKKSSGASSRTEPWVDPDDAPEWTDEMLDRAEIRHGDTIIRSGNPPMDYDEGAVTLRLDPDVIEAYRALGDDWMVRINADLRRARKLKKA